MNRKGFAITTVIYGLTVLGLMIVVILMGLLSSTRNNVSSEAKRIEKELIAYNLASKSYSIKAGETNRHRVPEGEAGWYRIEAFGKYMGNNRGAYTTGIIYLPTDVVLEIGEKNNGATVSLVAGATKHELMYATGATGTTGSATLARYSKSSSNAKFDQLTFVKDATTNVIGSNGTTYDSSVKSTIVGYPGGETGKISYYIDGVEVPFYFVDCLMVPNVNKGEARVSITKLAADEYPTASDYAKHFERIPGRNEKYNKVKRIIVTASVPVSKVSVAHQGVFTETAGCAANTPCVVSLGSPTNIDDISVLFDSSLYNTDIGGKSTSYVKIDAVKDNDAGVEVEKTLYSSLGDELSNGEKPTTIVPTGIKLSSYQPDYLDDDLPKHGTYYIFPVNTESRVWSARESAEEDQNAIYADLLTGEARQKWAVDIITTAVNKNATDCKELTNTDYKLFKNIYNQTCNTEYRIMELTRFKSISIQKDENLRRNDIVAAETFNSLSRNDPHVWSIRSLNDGTFAIKTVIVSSNPSQKAGFLTADSNVEETSSEYMKIMIGTALNPGVGTNEKDTRQTAIERVRFYAVDFVRE